MKLFVLLFCLFSFNFGENPHSLDLNKYVELNPSNISISYPKNNQKVRGEIKIYGKAKPGSIVKIQITSSYFKKAYKGETISKGEGPLKRLNRSYSVTTNKQGLWVIDKIDLTNAGWEEDFIIKASADGKTDLVNVYDHTHSVRID